MGLFDFFKKGSSAKITQSDPRLLPVTVAPNITFPAFMEPYWPAIEATQLKAVHVTLTASTELALEQSKLGHYPYLPIEFPYPTDDTGAYLFPLAQINLSEVPPLEGYPVSGYLQFYLSVTDDVYGIDFTNPSNQSNFRVLYFEEEAITDYRVDFSFLNETMAHVAAPMRNAYALTFKYAVEYFGEGDVRSEMPGRISMNQLYTHHPDLEDDAMEAIDENFNSGGHKIGGYAWFTQSDPRDLDGPYKDYILLLQIDSNDDIIWGDSGVANFFIHPNDLANKDFSKVMFHWDCY